MGIVFRLLFVLTGTLWLASCSAPADTGREWPEPSPALWEISNAQGDTAWLFGTIHALPDEVAWRTPAFTAAFDQAGLLVVEIANLGDREAMQAAYDRHAFDDDPLPIFSRYGYQFNERLEDLLARGDIEQHDLDPLKDWAAAITLAGALREGDPANGVDRALLATDKPRTGLESYEQQFAMFDALDGASLLNAVVWEEATRDQSKAVEAWLTGDLVYLEGMAKTGILDNPELRKALLIDRNARWIEQIEPLVASGRKPFIAVGAGHVLGADGLPALLEARGYTLRRIQ